jgi:dephospho-CoA kinase
MRGIRIKNWNFIIGLTGGIGSGKSTVLALFKKKGAFVLDCDRIVHHLLDKDKKVKKELIGQFGPELFDHGLLNKKALAKLVFQSPVKRKLLENIIHPRVRKSVIQSLKSKKEAGEGTSQATIPARLRRLNSLIFSHSL